MARPRALHALAIPGAWRARIIASAPWPTPSAQFSLTLRVELPQKPGGVLGKVTAAITRAGGAIVAVDTVEARGEHTLREITVECSSVEHRGEVISRRPVGAPGPRSSRSPTAPSRSTGAARSTPA